ncbi:MAG: SMC-Scp complex subunit ScpB [Clostridia bacterium]|nr:SMC-Scp complex subunit ScpB [Clostridia bacterium]
MENLANIIESILFVSGDAVAIKDIAEKSNVTEKDVLNAVKTLQDKYSGESGINLLVFNKKLQFCSNSNYADAVSNVLNPIKERELSKSMLEVAAIIAYKQPVTRIDLEELRGSNSEFALQNLLKLGVIEVVGRKDTVGKPVLFGTTDEFLKRFQISSLEDLPDYEELMQKIVALRSPANDSAYLFEKDEYVEGEVNPLQKAVEETESLNDNEPEVTVSEGDFELPDIEAEELPEHLRGESVEVIK